ncbi:MAG: TonB family protein [Akkermansiaceae bacterium]|nr:TonB family protein [Armatimonadota bacterium]
MTLLTGFFQEDPVNSLSAINKISMNDTQYEPFTVADRKEAGRFPTAIIFSVVVNILFLTGASTIIRAQSAPMPSGDTGYIILDRIDLETSKPSPEPTAQKPELPLAVARLPLPARRRMPDPIPTRTEKVMARPATRQVARAKTSVNLDSKQLAVAVAEPKADVESPPVAMGDSENAGANVAASNLTPGDTSPSESEGNNSLLTTDEPSASGASSAPTPVESPSGVTKDAELAHQELPRLPDALRDSGYRSSVGVKVEVMEDGAFTVTIRTSSGNPDVDIRVLDALKRWKWKPALKNGIPITSTQSFDLKFEID